MKKASLSRASLGRLPKYLEYLRTQDNVFISASEIARALKLGEVLVRKDLFCVCDKGRPKIGYPRVELISNIEEVLGTDKREPVVIVGTGKLGQALMHYSGFEEFGLKIIAGFDSDPAKIDPKHPVCPVFPVKDLPDFCRSNDVHVGIITVPADAAQSVFDSMVKSGITAVWNFVPHPLKVPEGINVQNENLPLSLAYLCLGGKAKDDER